MRSVQGTRQTRRIKKTKQAWQHCARGTAALLFLCAVLFLSVFALCGSTQAAPQTAPQTAGTAREAEVTKEREAEADAAAPEAAEISETTGTTEAAETTEEEETGSASADGENSIVAEAVPEEDHVVISDMEEQEGITLSLSYGYQNTAKADRYLPVVISVGNHTAEELDAQAELRILGGQTVCYRFRVPAAAGEETQIHTSVSVTQESEAAELRLLDAEGTEIASSVTDLSVQGMSDEVLVGLLSRTPQELSYFRGLSIGSTALRTRTVVLDEEELPDEDEGLAQLDVLLVSRFDLGRLSDDQIRVIAGWVDDGGALLLGTGGESDPLGAFSERIEGVTLSASHREDVNMGLQYSTDGPDGAVLSLTVRDIYADNGIQALQSGDLAVLTTVSSGSGVIGLCAFDLCDVRDFCTREIGYPDELLRLLLGNTRIQELVSRSASTSADYEEVRGLISIPEADRYPNMAVYLILAVCYTALAGPGLYIFMKQRGMELYYAHSVVILSVTTALLVWFAGLSTRYEQTAASYAALTERSGDEISETGIVGLSSPGKTPFRLFVDSAYQVQPVLSAETENAGAGEEILIDRTERGSVVECVGYEPFETQIFRIYGSREAAEDETTRVSLSLRCFEDELSGSITNEGTDPLYDAALLLYGRIVSVGNLNPGESRDLSGYEIIYGPTGSGSLTAEYLAGLWQAEVSDTQGYTEALFKARLLGYYIKNAVNSYYGGAKILAFRDTGRGSLPGADLGRTESSGKSLYAESVQVDFRRGTQVYRSALSAEPKIISGVYDTGSNTMSGTAALVLEYSLGTDLRVTSLRFNGLSDAFSGREDENGMTLRPFAGERAVYNYRTGEYDELKGSDISISEETLSQYLSPSNTITVRYLPDETISEGSELFLPVPTVTGVEK